MKKLIPALFALLLTVSLTSCKEKLYNQLEGDWNVTSFEVEGFEQLQGGGVEMFAIEFDDYDSADKEGDFSWKISYDDGSSESLSGTYEVDEEDKVVTFNFDNPLSASYDFDLDLDGDELSLEGNLDGSEFVIEAERD